MLMNINDPWKRANQWCDFNLVLKYIRRIPRLKWEHVYFICHLTCLRPGPAGLGLALLTLSWDKNWDSHSPMNGYPSFYPRIALVAPSPGKKLGVEQQLCEDWLLTALRPATCRSRTVGYLITEWSLIIGLFWVQSQWNLHKSGRDK